MEKTLLELAQEAFSDWLRLVDDILCDAELSFEEFSGHGVRRELEEAGAALARAERAVRQARAVLATVILEESSPPLDSKSDTPDVGEGGG